MNLKQKHVWDLNLNEIEYIYQKLHMNNYVYAALMTYHKSNPPLNKQIKLNKRSAPACLFENAQKMAELSPYLGNDDPQLVRIHYTYYAYELFSRFKHLKIQDIGQTIALMSALSYVPIIAEKNDNLLIWWNMVIRKKTQFIKDRYDSIKDKIDIDEFVKLPYFENEKNQEEDLSPIDTLFEFIPRAVSSVIIMLENGLDLEQAATAFVNIEKNMIEYEQKHRVGNLKEFPKNVKHHGQTRYRNTLYLYGGTVFERMGRYEEAFSWYTKDLYFVDIYDTFGFYLTALKTCERLLCAYRVAAEKKETTLFKSLIDHCFKKAFLNASDYAAVVLDYVRSTPGLDLSLERFDLGNNKYMLYAGEPSREIFLISLLYNKIINNEEYGEIGYSTYFDFVN